MASELNIKIVGLLALIALLLTFTYLFIEAGEYMVPLILFFIAIISALALIGIVFMPKK
ncbi:MAG: hypothetical protein L6N96_05400 [Candidatus Methylarchaceae archaeon HK02M2]|nr:hypothetical protein [Candidatus Methylarchaceae archaeon HK02M2]